MTTADRICLLNASRKIQQMQLLNLSKLHKYRSLNNLDVSASEYYSLVAEGRSLHFIYNELIVNLGHRNKIIKEN